MRLIGKGGFSKVFRGETFRLQNKVGIKKLHNDPKPHEVVKFEGKNKSPVSI